jgi:hypothetical protein
VARELNTSWERAILRGCGSDRGILALRQFEKIRFVLGALCMQARNDLFRRRLRCPQSRGQSDSYSAEQHALRECRDGTPLRPLGRRMDRSFPKRPTAAAVAGERNLDRADIVRCCGRPIELMHASHPAAISTSGGKLLAFTRRLVFAIAHLSKREIRVSSASTKSSSSSSGRDLFT